MTMMAWKLVCQIGHKEKTFSQLQCQKPQFPLIFILPTLDLKISRSCMNPKINSNTCNRKFIHVEVILTFWVLKLEYTVTIQDSLVKTIADDALASGVTRSSAAMISTMYPDKQVLVFYEQRYWLPAPCQCWIMIRNVNIFSCILISIQQDKHQALNLTLLAMV